MFIVTPEQIALHRHWCRADAIKYVLFGVRPTKKKIPEDLRQLAELHSRFLRLEVFYGLIYVVIEGYIELGKHLSMDRIFSLVKFKKPKSFF